MMLFPVAVTVSGTVMGGLPGHKYIIMQFTGLKDKDGKEIWEGDILVEWFSGKRLDWATWEVKIVNCTCGYQCCNPKNHPPEDHYFKPFYEEDEWLDMNHYEVIGNIYEDKELLDEA